MAHNRKRGNSLAKRKLEIAICALFVVLAALLVIFIINFIKGDKKDDNTSGASSISSQESQGSSSDTIESTTASSSKSDSSDTAPSNTQSSTGQNSAVSPAGSSMPASSVLSASSLAGDYINYTKTGAGEINEWYLRLVNADNLLEDSWRPTDLKVIDNDGRKIDARVYNAYRALMDAAKADGISLYPISAYRTYDVQNSLYQNRVNRSLNQNPNFTRIEAENDAAKHVARPKTSDHELGLAVDFNSTEVSFADTAQGKWLKANCTDYGFILRYSKDKQDITMVSFEPWHFRFVGVKHAKKMQELNMCLEEYVEYLK